MSYPNLSAVPYGSDEYFAALTAANRAEEKQFLAAGWQPLNNRRPFYLHPAGVPEGTCWTVAHAATDAPGPGFDVFAIAGEVAPPPGAWSTLTVYIARQGEWTILGTAEAASAIAA